MNENITCPICGFGVVKKVKIDGVTYYDCWTCGTTYKDIKDARGTTINRDTIEEDREAGE